MGSTQNVIAGALFLVVWQGVAMVPSAALVVAGPIEIGAYIWDNAALLTRAMTETLRNAAWGFLWGNLAALILASVAIVWPRTQRVISTFALIVFCLPLIATGPILRVLYGPGSGPQVILAALSVYFTTYLVLCVGLRAAPRSWGDLMAVYGRGAWTHLGVIRLRASLPYLVAGLQIAAPAAVLGAMIGEFTGAERGLGVLTLRSMQGLRPDATWAIALLASGLSLAVYAVIGAIGRRLVGYRAEVLLTPPSDAHRLPVHRRVLSVGAVIMGALLVWHVGMQVFDLNPFFAKRPLDVAAFLMTAPQAANNRAILFTALGDTVSLTTAGYIAGLVLGAGLAAVLVVWSRAAPAILPVALTLRSVPIISTAPLIVLVLGRGALGTIVIVAVMIFFPTLVACAQGFRQTPGQVRDVFDSYRTPAWRRLIWADIPAALPAFFAAARIAVPAALLAATTTEWLATGRGIGVLMALTATTSNYNMLWSCIVVLCAVALMGYAVVAGIERAVLRRYAPEQVSA